MATKTIDYIESPIKQGNSRAVKNKLTDNVLDKFSTGRIIWYLFKKHKFGLVLTWAVLMTISYAFPPFWDILGALISGM